MTFDIQERVFHFKQPAGTSRGVYTERRSWLVTLSNDNCSATGECAPLPDLSCDALPPYKYKEVLQRFCQQVAATGSIDHDSMRDFPSMLFGLETALRGLEAGGQGAALFNTPFTRGEEGIPINGLVWMGSYDEMLNRLEDKLKQEFACVKLKIGAIDFEQELQLVKLIRQRFSRHDVELRLDANGAFRFDEALYKLELLSQYAVHSIEQPIKAGQWSFMAELCRESPLPIALDEELIGVNDPDQKRQMLHIIKPAYIVLKPSLHGGMGGCREWIETAAEEDIGSWITSALESNVGLNAIAQFCSDVYGPHITMPQGLGTGLLFTDNIDMPIEIRGSQLWMKTE
jgi:o-succinylbenzoate synthase